MSDGTGPHNRAPRWTFEVWPGGMGPPVILLGAGNGALLRELLDGPLAGSRQPIAIIVPASCRDRFEASVAAGAWDGIDRDRVRFAIGDDPSAALDRAFADLGPARLHGASILVGDERLSDDERQRCMSILAQRHRGELQSIEAASGRFRAAVRTRVLPPRSVFGAADRSTTALRFLGADLIAAARQLGLRGTFLELDHRHDPFRPLRRLEALLEAQPDCLLSFVASRQRDWGAIAAGIPTLSYWSSDPTRYDIERMGFGEDDLVCVSDAAWTESFARIGVRAHHLPLASGLRAALDPALDRSECERNRVLLVGNLPAAEDVLPSDLHALLPSIHGAAAEFLDCADGCTADAFARSLAREPLQRATVARAIEFAATRLERLRVATTLAAANVPLRIHGCARWQPALAGTAAEGLWEGALGDRASSAAAFRNAAAVINVVSRNGRDGVNMRVFDVAACGGVLVSSDTPGLRRAFAVGHEAVAFSTVAALPELVRPLLDDPSRRAAIRAAAETRALRDHTWEARWRRVFVLLAERCVGAERAVGLVPRLAA